MKPKMGKKKKTKQNTRISEENNEMKMWRANYFSVAHKQCETE